MTPFYPPVLLSMLKKSVLNLMLPSLNFRSNKPQIFLIFPYSILPTFPFFLVLEITFLFIANSSSSFGSILFKLKCHVIVGFFEVIIFSTLCGRTLLPLIQLNLIPRPSTVASGVNFINVPRAASRSRECKKDSQVVILFCAFGICVRR